MVNRLTFLFILLLLPAGFQATAAADEETPWAVELQVKRYIGSHTSYEFGNPFPPCQAPLSRLEFPIDTWWSGGKLTGRFPRISLGVEIMRNINRDSDGAFTDSDWDDDDAPQVKTIYSVAECRMEPSYIICGNVDLKIADWVGLPAWFDLRPVAGIRWQRFELITHDGEEFFPLQESIPGEGIHFTQTYRQYFLGLKTEYDLERHFKTVPLTLLCQIDWAYVEGDNSDHHLLRVGNRWTYEKTHGEAWHVSVGARTNLTKNVNATVEAEYLRITTHGSHRLTNEVFDIDIGVDHGVKVYSEQKNIMFSLEYLF